MHATRPPRWARFGCLSHLMARTVSLSKQPVLLYGLARSGTSWVGHVLSMAPSCLYLREPLTQSVLSMGSKPVFYPLAAHQMPELMGEALERAFIGLPDFAHHIVKDKPKWALHKRIGKRVLIKEVYMPALKKLLVRYQPKLIFLVRHPAALARSWHALGYTVNQKRFWPEEYQQSAYARDFWGEMGLLSGLHIQQTLADIESYTDKLIVQYEDLCLTPSQGFKQIYDFIQEPFCSNIEQHLQEITQDSNAKQAADPYSVRRQSEQRILAWKNELSLPDINSLKSAYLSFGLDYYPESQW